MQDAEEFCFTGVRALVHLENLAMRGNIVDQRKVRVAQQALQDALVLKCTQGVPHAVLSRRGLPPAVKALFSNVIAGTTPDQALQENLLSRLGTAKYAVYNAPVKFNKRRAKPKHR